MKTMPTILSVIAVVGVALVINFLLKRPVSGRHPLAESGGMEALYPPASHPARQERPLVTPRAAPREEEEAPLLARESPPASRPDPRKTLAELEVPRARVMRVFGELSLLFDRDQSAELTRLFFTLPIQVPPELVAQGLPPEDEPKVSPADQIIAVVGAHGYERLMWESAPPLNEDGSTLSHIALIAYAEEHPLVGFQRWRKVP